MKTQLMLSALLAAAMGTGAALANDSTKARSGATESGAEYSNKQLEKSGKGGNADHRATHGDTTRGNTTMRSGVDSPAKSKSGAEYSAEQIRKSRSGTANDGTMRGSTSTNRTDRSSMSDNQPKGTGDAGTSAIGDGTKKP